MANSFKKLLCLCQLCLYSRCRSLAAFLAAVLERAERKQFVFLTSDYQTKASENNFAGMLPITNCLKRGGWQDADSVGFCPTCWRGQGCWLSWDETKEQLSSLFWDTSSSCTDSCEMAKPILYKNHERSLFSFSFMPVKSIASKFTEGEGNICFPFRAKRAIFESKRSQ